MHWRRIMPLVLTLAFTCLTFAEDSKPAVVGSETVPIGAKVYIGPMADGFDTYLKAALARKKVPLQVVDSREQAQFEITGTSESQKASTAKKVLFLDWHSTEQASIRLTNMQSGQVIWAYSVHKQSSAHGKQSSAEACAKHLKDVIERK